MNNHSTQMASSADIRLIVDRVRVNSKDRELVFKLADTLADAGSIQLADALLENALRRMPTATSIHASRAALALREGKPTQALAHLERHCSEAPNDIEAHLAAASVELMRLQLTVAESHVQKALRVDPKYGRSHYLLGLIYELLKLPTAAAVAYRLAIQFDPTLWEPYNNLALLLLEDSNNSRVGEAKALLQRAIEIAPEAHRAEVTYNLALACVRLGDLQTSQALVRQALALPHLPPTLTDKLNRLRAATTTAQ